MIGDDLTAKIRDALDAAVLLSVGELTPNAYSVNIRRAANALLPRSVSQGAICAVLDYLERNGIIVAQEGVAILGDRPIRGYTLTKYTLTTEGQIVASELAQRTR